MRVCNVCLTHDPAFGGLHRSVHDFATALSAPVLSFDAGGGTRRIVEDGVAVCRVGCGTGWLSRDCHVMPAEVAGEAGRVVDDMELLVVHSLFRAHATWAARWARRSGRRYWAVPHGCLDPRGLAQRGLLKRLWLEAWGRSYLAGAERIVVSSKRSLQKSLPWIPADRGVVVHWPVNQPGLADRAAAQAAFRGRHGIPEEARVLLFVGRLHAVKRPIETVRAFCEAEAADCHLVMIGMDGDITRSQVSAATPANCQERVHVVGPLVGAGLVEALLAGDGFVSLSYQENFGYAAAEALAYGLPVILSPGHDLAHEMPCLDGRFACGWLLGDDAHATAVAAIREWADAAEAALWIAGATGRAWVGDVLTFERFRDRLSSMV